MAGSYVRGLARLHNNRYREGRDRGRNREARRHRGRPPPCTTAPEPTRGADHPRATRRRGDRGVRGAGLRAGPRPGHRPRRRAHDRARSTPTSATSASCCSRRSRPGARPRSRRCSRPQPAPDPATCSRARLADGVPRGRPSAAARRRRRVGTRPAARRAAARRARCSATRESPRSSTTARPTTRSTRAIDTDVLTRFCLTLALGSLVVRTLALPQPDPDSWDSLIERLLDARGPIEAGSEPHDDHMTATLPTAENRELVQGGHRHHVHLGLRADPAGARQAVREGEDLAVERHDRPRLVDGRGPGEGRRRAQRRHDGAVPRAAGGRRLTGRSTSARRSGPRSACRCRTRCSRSSSTASRARCSARRASSRPFRGSTPSTTRPPR